ncbi:MAG TPA: P-loop NTPase [Planctomycetota bacterium]|nr:P-loop NTPase [Planctomycetota bacterium]
MTLACASGKGGTGKSFVAANLATAFAARLGRCAMMDADFGLGNSHLYLGVRPRQTLQHWFEQRTSLEELVLESSFGVDLLPAGSGVPRLAELPSEELVRLAKDLPRAVGHQKTLILDAAAGVSTQTLRIVGSADRILLVVTPDLSALTDGYALAKCLWLRDQDLVVDVVVNKATEDAGKRAFDRLQDVAGRFLDLPLHYVGAIPFDAAAERALRKQRPLVLSEPDAPAALALVELADRIAGRLATQRRSGRFFERLALR